MCVYTDAISTCVRWDVHVNYAQVNGDLNVVHTSTSLMYLWTCTTVHFICTKFSKYSRIIVSETPTMIVIGFVIKNMVYIYCIYDLERIVLESRRAISTYWSLMSRRHMIWFTLQMFDFITWILRRTHTGILY